MLQLNRATPHAALRMRIAAAIQQAAAGAAAFLLMKLTVSQILHLRFCVFCLTTLIRIG